MDIVVHDGNESCLLPGEMEARFAARSKEAGGLLFTEKEIEAFNELADECGQEAWKLSDFSPAKNTGCVPLDVDMNDNSQDALLYYWSAPGGTISDPNVSNPSITYDTPGAYSDIQLIIKDGDADGSPVMPSNGSYSSAAWLRSSIADPYISAAGSSREGWIALISSTK